MLSGSLEKQQDLIDLINGYLINRVGVLDLFGTKSSISLKIEHGNITAFSSKEAQESREILSNKKSALLFYMVEFLDSSLGFFSFREELPGEEFIHLEEGLHVEELILQTQLAIVELRSLLERLITPYAVLRAQESFPDMESYDGKSLYEIIITSKNGFVETLRTVKDLISKGLLDVHQFYQPVDEKDISKASVLIEGVEVARIRLLSIMESLKPGKFSGFLRIESQGFPAYLYYIKGRPVALYPISYPLFEFLIDPGKNARISAVKLDERVVKLLMLRHLQKKPIAGMTDKFLEIGKLLMGMSMESRSGMLVVRSTAGTYYMLYEKGSVIGLLKEKEDGVVEDVPEFNIRRPYWVELAFFEPMENMDKVVYMFIINTAYGIILRSGKEHLANSVISYVAGSDVFKYEEGQIKYRKAPTNTDDVVSFMSFLLDTGYKILGEKRLEEELEYLLQPYKEVFDTLNVQDYIKSFIEG